MDRRVLLVIASLALALTGFAMPKSGLFGASPQPKKPQTTAVAENPLTSEAALRHIRCQPRHWRALVMHK